MAAARIAKRKSIGRDDRDAEKIYLALKTAPGITSAQAEEIASASLDPQRHMWQRAALGVLSMPPGELCRKIETDREAAIVFAQTAQGIREYLTLQRTLLDILDGAQVRIELALCKREDYLKVLAKAGVEQKASKRLYRLNGAPAAVKAAAA